METDLDRKSIDSRTNLNGRSVKLNEDYFERMGESAVFTQGRSYRVLESDQRAATIKDDNGVRRRINRTYLSW